MPWSITPAAGVERDLRAILKKIIPGFLWRFLADLRDRVLHRGKYDFRLKRDRQSPFEYTTRYDHRSIRRARKSILWDDDWEGATRATIAVLRELSLLGDAGTIVDYGGGIGRISRAVLEDCGSRVILVDRSAEMRGHARKYIPRKLREAGRFVIWSDAEFMERMTEVEGGIDLILFIEALQHIPEPVLDDIYPKMLGALAPRGRVFVLGNKDLDVDREARRHHTLIGEFLRKHSVVLREDSWSSWERSGTNYKFKYPRYSFLCGAKS